MYLAGALHLASQSDTAGLGSPDYGSGQEVLRCPYRRSIVHMGSGKINSSMERELFGAKHLGRDTVGLRGTHPWFVASDVGTIRVFSYTIPVEVGQGRGAYHPRISPVVVLARGLKQKYKSEK